MKIETMFKTSIGCDILAFFSIRTKEDFIIRNIALFRGKNDDGSDNQIFFPRKKFKDDKYFNIVYASEKTNKKLLSIANQFYYSNKQKVYLQDKLKKDLKESELETISK